MSNLNTGERMSAMSGRFSLILLLLLLGGRYSTEGQSRFDPRFYELASRISERLVVSTDRSLYIAGETVRFRADRIITGADEVRSWSSVIYVELTDAAGKTVSAAKFPLREGYSTGSVPVPPGTLTGNYMLKCYTRWMRNEGPGCFSYTGLKIIQPFRKEVVRNGTHSGDSRQDSMVHWLPDTLSCKVTAEQRGTTDQMKISVTVPAIAEGEIRGCLTVVPRGAEPELIGSDMTPFPVAGSGASPDIQQINFLPDRGQGLSLTGSVVNEQDELVPLLPLRFSLLGERPDFFATVTDSRGRFAIQIPAGEGDMELFVSPRSRSGESLQVRIDQDFDRSPPVVEPPVFSLPESQRELAGRMALNQQLEEAFLSGHDHREKADSAVSGEGRVTDPSDPSHVPFYGTPMFSLDMDDYVELPLLEEVFINLVPMVQVVRKKKQTRLEILSDNPAMDYYSPLLLIDHIPIQDHADVMGLPPGEISRIDVIHDVYVKGSLAFGGVISIFSRKGDMAGIDLPRGAYFFDFTGFKSTRGGTTITAPASFSDQRSGSRIPDTRNTVLWVPDLTFREKPGKAEKTAVITCAGPVKKGGYVVLFRGVDSFGRIYEARSRFRSGEFSPPEKNDSVSESL